MLIFEGLISYEGKQYRYQVTDLGKELRKLEIFHPDGNITVVTYKASREFKDVFESAIKKKNGGGQTLSILISFAIPALISCVKNRL